MTVEVNSVLESALTDRYRIQRELGRGGMGIVYLADDLRHGRQVAIKVMRPEVTASESAERFHREILTIARLAHPGIVPVFDSGVAGTALFFVMPYIGGPSLREVIQRDGPLPIDRAIAIVTAVGDALTYAHERGIVHRDIKPGNILLDGDRPMVADFGLALAAESGQARLSQSFIVGTPEYMGPEQATPHGPIDGRADQYSLACVLFELLAGEPPVTGPTPHAVLARKAAGEARSLRVVRPAVPRGIEEVISRALQPVPADRYPSVRDFVQALHAPATRFWTLRRAVAAGALAIAAIAGASAVIGGRASRIDPALVVIAPFENQTGRPRFDPLGLMVADWIAEGLHDVQAVRVVPTPTAQQASQQVAASTGRDGGDPLAKLGHATGASVIVSGRYYLEGDRVTFRAQVSDLAPGSWLPGASPRPATLRATTEPISAHVDSASAALPAIRSRVMGLVALSGEDELTRGELEERPPNYEAYVRFAEGMALYVAEDTMQAAQAFLDAYARDTTFKTALLYAALNFSNARRYSIEDSLLRVVARSEDRLSSYHRRWLEYRRAFLDGDRPRALRAIRALAANAPRSKAVYNLGIEAWENGHLEEAVAALQSLDPDAGPMQGFQHYWGALANIHHLLGDYSDALEAARKARAADRGGWRPVGWELAALIALGRTDQAMTQAAPLVHASPDDNQWSPAEALREAAEEARAHGQPAAADSLWRMALAWYRSAERRPVLPRDRFGLAHTLYALDRLDEADSAATKLHADFPSDVAALGLLGTIAARRGNSARAAEISALLEGVTAPFQLGRPTYQRALIAAASGDDQRAMDLLRLARQEGRSYQIWVHRELDFERLRTTPSYRSLLRPVPLSLPSR